MSEHVPNKKVVVVLPAYRAVRTLERTLRAIPREWVDEIVLVDDDSNDGTADLARSLGIDTILHQKNRGYGGNQKTCYARALELGADIVVMVHPDFQYDPYYVPDLIRPIAEGRADAVFGSRMMIPGGARAGGMPLWKYVANIALSKLGNFMTGLSLSEYHSGLRAYSKEVLLRAPIELNSDNFVFDTEIIAQLRAFDFEILEMPISTRYFPEASMIGFWKSCEYGLSFVRVLCQYVLHHWKLWRFDKFLPVVDENTICPGCRQRRIVDIYPPRNSEKVNYRITDSDRSHGRIVSCVKCKLVFEPREKLVVIDYSNQPLDHEYLSEESGRRRTAKRALDKISELRGHDKRALFEVGAGPGFFLDEARKNNFVIMGAEEGKSWCRYAENLLGKNVVECGGIEVLKAKGDRSIDIISAWDVIEHLEDPISFIKLAFDKLRVDGVLALSVPRWGSLVQIVAGEKWHALIPGHVTYFTENVLRSYLEMAGFKIAFVRSYRRYFSLQYLLNRLFKFKGDTFLRKIIIPVNLFDEIEIYCSKS